MTKTTGMLARYTPLVHTFSTALDQKGQIRRMGLFGILKVRVQTAFLVHSTRRKEGFSCFKIGLMKTKRTKNKVTWTIRLFLPQNF